MTDLKEFIPLLLKTARLAGQKIMEIYEKEDFDVQIKADKTPVTLADMASHKIIVEELTKTGLPLLSEEDSEISFAERKKWEHFWLIDPLDGTREFINRNGEFTVNIALIQKNQPVLGVVYIPVADTVFYGGVDVETHKVHKDNEPIKLEKPQASPQKNRVLVSRSHLHPMTQRYIDKIPNAEIIAVGSSLKFLYLAEGRADIYRRFGPTMEWDTAAAHAVLRGLNLKVINPNTNLPLIYNKESLKNPAFLASL